ncbi:uncharacterized protein LOC129959969 [Argiope bruennichi]|uniref:Uncharacterized protein n=1 Tax=Argiope bruennichi TaxID=94029 RepID=A0A8T0FQV9_ARGBR|nr:uncharacterized protein LOC129959969 [Argiope bruennichi]KAF8791103.1 hypothetical protein HNY73_006027 [Argiope bruennichi]
MTLLRVLLMSGAIIVSVQTFPSTTRDYEKKSTAELEAKETTDSIPVHTEDPQTMLEIQTNSDGESSTIEFVLKSPKEGMSIQKGSAREKYTISNLTMKNEAEKLNLLDSSKANEIESDRKDELYKLNITVVSKIGDFPTDIQIKRDQWLFNPQEMSSIMGGLPKYYYDAAKPIRPFPELSETEKGVAINSEKRPVNLQAPLVEKSNQPPETGGPLLYPQSVFSREIDVPFYF